MARDQAWRCSMPYCVLQVIASALTPHRICCAITSASVLMVLRWMMRPYARPSSVWIRRVKVPHSPILNSAPSRLFPFSAPRRDAAALAHPCAHRTWASCPAHKCRQRAAPAHPALTALAHPWAAQDAESGLHIEPAGEILEDFLRSKQGFLPLVEMTGYPGAP